MMLAKAIPAPNMGWTPIMNPKDCSKPFTTAMTITKINGSSRPPLLAMLRKKATGVVMTLMTWAGIAARLI